MRKKLSRFLDGEFAVLLAQLIIQQIGWFAVFLVALLLAAPSSADPVSAERQSELESLLYQDCGSCHGMRLTGGLGPALTADRLRVKPRALLVSTVLEGRQGTPMPPWKNLLSEEDVNWLVDYLLAQDAQS